MKKKMFNDTHIEGWIYEHKLEAKVSGENSKNPGTEYITGTLDIATDNACTNIVSIHFTYVTPTTSTGKTNATYTVLNNIINGVYKTVMKDGKDSATKVRVDSAIGLNEFYSDRSGKEELVSAKRNEGGFIHVTDTLDEDETHRSTFNCDMIINHVSRIEADDEKGTPEKAIIKGCIFDFRNAILPVEFTALNPNAMNYFEDLGASEAHPVFTRVQGRQISENIVHRVVEKGAFGEDHVKEISSKHKDFVITWAAELPYEWDDESTITVNELSEAIAKRETYLATIKQRQDEYNASKGNKAAAPATGGFKF